jgi:hypothetical protein
MSRTPKDTSSRIHDAKYTLFQYEYSCRSTNRGLAIYDVIPRAPLAGKFQANMPAKVQVLPFVNHTHAASAELFKNAVVRKHSSDRRFRHWVVILGWRNKASQKAHICVPALAQQLLRTGLITTYLVLR